MNYGIISVLIVMACLILIFVYYEKKKLSVKEIAIIATMSGLAGVSRVPFAAIPNLQPTTFLVIVSGYVFGPIFGFMVGVVSTLVSNSFLGHGPWTPWQMIAWGLAGASAGLLKKIGKKPSKIVLGIFAFLWGFLYGYIMNLWHWLFFIYPLNFRSFIAININSFYFDLIHAIGNFVFAYLFGTDVINVLIRFKDRISYTEVIYKK